MRAGGNHVAGRILAGMVLGLAGCAAPAVAPPPAAPAVVSYDGRYEGTVMATGGTVGAKPGDCDTPSALAIDVRGNRFTLTITHPKAAETPSLRDRQATVYAATIAPDGRISGISDASGATLDGQVTGAAMRGQVYGLLCYYAYDARRI